MRRLILGTLLLSLLGARVHAQTSFSLVAGTTTGLTGIITAWYDDEATRQSDMTPAFWAWGIEFFDYNQDGCLDIFFQNHNTSFHPGGTIAEHDKTGDTCDLTFTDVTTSLIADKRDLPASAGKARLVDLDKNGFPDIIGLFNASGNSDSFLNDGSTLTEIAGPEVVISYPSWRQSAALAERPLEGIVDFNEDGHPDVVNTRVDEVAGTATGYRWNNATSRFVAVTPWYATPTVPEVPQSINDHLTTLYTEDCGEEASANNPGHHYVEYDANNDGLMDLLLVIGGAYGSRRETLPAHPAGRRNHA